MVELLVDRRIGTASRYYLGDRSEKLMRVPDTIRECVAFICCRDARGDLRYAGTGFFVGLPSIARPDLVFWLFRYRQACHSRIGGSGL